MEQRLIIDVITLSGYMGMGPADARGRLHRRPIAVRWAAWAAWTAILLAFIATSLSGAALGQTAPAAPIVSDVPGAAVLGDVPVAEETERGLFLGVGRHG